MEVGPFKEPTRRVTSSGVTGTDKPLFPCLSDSSGTVSAPGMDGLSESCTAVVKAAMVVSGAVPAGGAEEELSADWFPAHPERRPVRAKTAKRKFVFFIRLIPFFRVSANRFIISQNRFHAQSFSFSLKRRNLVDFQKNLN